MADSTQPSARDVALAATEAVADTGYTDIMDNVLTSVDYVVEQALFWDDDALQKRSVVNALLETCLAMDNMAQTAQARVSDQYESRLRDVGDAVMKLNLFYENRLGDVLTGYDARVAYLLTAGLALVGGETTQTIAETVSNEHTEQHLQALERISRTVLVLDGVTESRLDSPVSHAEAYAPPVGGHTGYPHIMDG